MEFQADIEGASHTASTAFLCTDLDITDAASGVGLVLMDADGTLFDGTATSNSGTLPFNTGGGAVLMPSDVSTLPKTIGMSFHPSSVAGHLFATRPMTDTFAINLPIILNGWPLPPDDWFYNLPLPYSRVIVAIRP